VPKPKKALRSPEVHKGVLVVISMFPYKLKD
jgi:hypothetical protein